jgi:hypothetical protein
VEDFQHSDDECRYVAFGKDDKNFLMVIKNHKSGD